MRQFNSLMLLAALSVPVACSVQEGQLVDMAGGTQAIGGSTGVGGTSAKSGGSSTGGSTNAGGTGAKAGNSSTGGSAIAVGGTQSAGGASNTGGSKASGGTMALGGATGTSSAAGATATGGMAATGGTQANTGGASATGGTKSLGGSPATAGTTSAGGVPSTGGVSATGGAPSTGGISSTGVPAYCTFNSVLYSNGAPNPTNACQVCETVVSTTEWVQLSEGASCGTGGGTVCHSGTCQTGCWIGSVYYVANAVNTANACQTCQPVVSTAAWSTGAEGAECGINGSPTVCHNGTCQSGCWIGSTYYAAGAVNGPCQTCQPMASTTTWTPGSLETIQSSTGLCVAKMVPISAPSASDNYSIDATEVTKGQYDLWLATNPALPASTDANCAYVTSYSEQTSGGPLYTGTDAAHHPVADVDWCDAYAYCDGVGKRLCGAIGGGPNAYGSYADSTLSQWYRACSSGGAEIYPYGITYGGTTCNGYDYWNDDASTATTVTAGSLANCVTSAAGYAGVFDLSGNVLEWEDSCSGTGQSATCRIRGGYFMDSGSSLTCGNDGYIGARNFEHFYVGFRCCSPSQLG